MDVSRVYEIARVAVQHEITEPRHFRRDHGNACRRSLEAGEPKGLRQAGEDEEVGGLQEALHVSPTPEEPNAIVDAEALGKALRLLSRCAVTDHPETKTAGPARGRQRDGFDGNVEALPVPEAADEECDHFVTPHPLRGAQPRSGFGVGHEAIHVDAVGDHDDVDPGILLFELALRAT